MERQDDAICTKKPLHDEDIEYLLTKIENTRIHVRLMPIEQHNYMYIPLGLPVVPDE